MNQRTLNSTFKVYFCPSNITSNLESSAGILLITEPTSFDVGDSCLILFNNAVEISADVDDAAGNSASTRTSSSFKTNPTISAIGTNNFSWGSIRERCV